MTFTELGLDLFFEQTLSEKNIHEPTAVQQQTIRTLLQPAEAQRIFFVESETGTGKTYAYLLPLLQLRTTTTIQPQILIIAPAKELASQIKTETTFFATRSNPSFSVALLVGDAPIKRQLDVLKTKPSVIIGTAGRILELIRLRKLKTEQITSIVFDEADRMTAPETRDVIGEIAATVPHTTRIVCCSATMKESAMRIMQGFFPTAVSIPLKLPPEDILRKRITHWAFFAEQRDKISLLRSFIYAEKPTKALIFTSEAGQVANIVSQLLYKKTTSVAGLSAKMDKVTRKKTIDGFRSGKVQLLVTSDVSARGLDIPDVTHIIQLDVPSNHDFFVHRAGRTARAGKTGINAVIGTAYDLRQLAKIEKLLHLTVYPKIISCGTITAPDFNTAEEEPHSNNARSE